MEELVKWYWEHGIKRGHDASDPDRELRKISIGGWLDPIVKIIDRNRAIQSNVNAKACPLGTIPNGEIDDDEPLRRRNAG